MKKKQKRTNNKDTTIKQFAFNTNYIVWLLGFGFTLWGNIYLYLEEKSLSWILALFLLLFILLLFIDAICYIFTKDEIHFVHFWGYAWRLPWLYVTSITKYGFWDSFILKKITGYEVYYDQPHKGRLIRKSLILALTPKVKKCLNKFYRGEIRFETKRQKKKR